MSWLLIVLCVVVILGIVLWPEDNEIGKGLVYPERTPKESKFIRAISFVLGAESTSIFLETKKTIPFFFHIKDTLAGPFFFIIVGEKREEVDVRKEIERLNFQEDYVYTRGDALSLFVRKKLEALSV